jgi:hypothetical protein
MMEAGPMAHLTLQIGVAIIAPVGPRRRARRVDDWRRRALREAALLQPQPLAWPASHLLAARVRGRKIGGLKTEGLKIGRAHFSITERA